MPLQLAVSVPIAVVSEANQSWNQSRFTKGKRVKAQRDAVRVYLRAKLCHLPGDRFPLPARCTLVRIAARELDTDNLAGAFKAVRDEVAALLGVDDGPRGPVEWIYRQEQAAPKRNPSIRIELEHVEQIGGA
jgi:hypothetical protein